MRYFWQGFLKKAEDPFSEWAQTQLEAEEKAKEKKEVCVEASQASRDYPFESYRGGFYP